LQHVNHESIITEDEYDISDSTNSSATFLEASMIMTLAERINMTRFAHFQKEIITALLSGRDGLIVHPTGSGKYLCYQFPPVFENRKDMHHQVTWLDCIGLLQNTWP